MIRVSRDEGKPETVSAIIWHDEVPLEARKGKHRKMKNRRYKQERMRRLVEDALD